MTAYKTRFCYAQIMLDAFLIGYQKTPKQAKDIVVKVATATLCEFRPMAITGKQAVTLVERVACPGRKYCAFMGVSGGIIVISDKYGHSGVMQDAMPKGLTRVPLYPEAIIALIKLMPQ